MVAILAHDNDLGKAFTHFNENGIGYAVLDVQYRAKYSLITVSPGDPDTDWFIKADTLEELARKRPGEAKERK